jgi:hypothetical protein
MEHAHHLARQAARCGRRRRGAFRAIGAGRATRAAVLLGLAAAGVAHGQEQGLSLTVGLRLMASQWTTFSYANNGTVLTQLTADDKVVWLPVAQARFGDWSVTASALPSTNYRFQNGQGTRRREWDANVGWTFVPGLTATLGYKSVLQQGDYRYAPRGPVVGLSANAALQAGTSLYGSVGVGKLKTPQSASQRDVQFDTKYRLVEVGLAHSLSGRGFAKAFTLTGGYRSQVMVSKDALNGEDGRDLTEGFTVGVIASF